MTVKGPHLSTSELYSFLAVAEQGAISRAASALGVTQPALSWTIRQLEERFETSLFVRSSRGVKLTRTGHILSKRARGLLRDIEELETELRDEQDTVRGLYSIGVHPTLATHTLPRFLPQLFAAWPELQITIRHGSSQTITQGVIDLQYDLGIVVNPNRHPELTIVHLYDDLVRIWASPQFKWATDQARIPILINPEMPQAEAILHALQKKNWFPDWRSVHTTDLHVISELTAASCGLGIIPEGVARRMPRTSLLAIKNGPTVKDQIALVWRRDAQRSKASQLIREAIKGRLQQKGSRRKK